MYNTSNGERVRKLFSEIETRFRAVSNVLGEREPNAPADEEGSEKWEAFQARISEYIDIFGIDLDDQHMASNLLLAVSSRLVGELDRITDEERHSQFLRDSTILAVLAKDIVPSDSAA